MEQKIETQPARHTDVSPPSCMLFSSMADNLRCPDVVMLNANASLAQLLGFAHGRCRELCMLANLASCSNEGENELRQAAEHLWTGLETVLSTLDAMANKVEGGS